jgi:hypothetical protein
VDRTTFEERLREAGHHVLLFARKYVLQQLPADLVFLFGWLEAGSVLGERFRRYRRRA